MSEQAGDQAEEASTDLAQLARDGLMPLGDLLAYAEQLQAQGHLQAACNLYGLWLAGSSDPRRHLAYFNYGTLLQAQGQTEQAVLAYQACLQLDPRFAQAAVNLGLSLERLGQTDQALQAWSQVVGQRLLSPSPSVEMQAAALNHIGRVQEQVKRYVQAEAALEDSLRLNPRQPGVIQHWVHIRQKACKWPVYKELPGISLGEMLRATSPLAMLALSDDPVQQLLTAQSFVARTYSMKEERLCEGRSYQHSKLRIGYVSADLREHAVGFLLPAFFKGHDSERCELYAYDYTPEEGSTLRRQLKGMFHQVRSIHDLSDREAAQLILHDEIDILIDLHGLSSGARPGIFALHPAPRQGTYLGFIGSTAMPWFDFVLADRQVLPPELAVHFTEKPLYLEGSFLPLAATPDALPALSRAELGLAEDAFVMGAFGNVYKITPQMFAAWMRLLARIPRSVLWLIDDNPETTANLQAEAAKAGIEPARLVFASRTDHVNFCARLRLADVFLDTYPYNCGSTARDIVNAGVPLVSLYGQTMVSRMGLSILHSVGCAHNAVATVADYEDRVVEVSLKKNSGQVPPYRHAEYSACIQTALEQLEGALRHSPWPPGASWRMGRLNADGPGLDAPTAVLHVDAPALRLYQWGRAGAPSGLYLTLPERGGDPGDSDGHARVRRHLLTHSLDENTFYGFLPPDFEERTGLGPQAVANLVKTHASCEILGLSPDWDMGSFFLNPFVQGEACHPGLLSVAQQFCAAMGWNKDLASQVMHSGNTVRAQFFVAKRRFWLRWLELAQRLSDLAENPDSPLFAALNAQAPGQACSLKVALQERLACLLLLQAQWPAYCHDVFALPPCEAPSHPFHEQALAANALKHLCAVSGQERYLTQFKRLQQEVCRLQASL